MQEGSYKHYSQNQNQDLEVVDHTSLRKGEDDDLAIKLEKYRKENKILMQLIEKEERKISQKEPQSAMIMMSRKDSMSVGQQKLVKRGSIARDTRDNFNQEANQSNFKYQQIYGDSIQPPEDAFKIQLKEALGPEEQEMRNTRLVNRSPDDRSESQELLDDEQTPTANGVDRQVSSIVDWNGASSRNLINLGVKDYIIEQWEGEEEENNDFGIMSYKNDNYLSPTKKKVKRK